MGGLTLEVLDTTLGRPASGVPICLEYQSGCGTWKMYAKGTTNDEGRADDLLTRGHAIWDKGLYRLTFETEQYLKSTNQSQESFFPCVPVIFKVSDPEVQYHVPLHISPFGLSVCVQTPQAGARIGHHRL